MYIDIVILDRDLVKYSNVDLKIMFYLANKNVSEYRVFQQFYHNCSHTCNCQCHVDVDIYLSFTGHPVHSIAETLDSR